MKAPPRGAPVFPCEAGGIEWQWGETPGFWPGEFHAMVHGVAKNQKNIFSLIFIFFLLQILFALPFSS